MVRELSEELGVVVPVPVVPPFATLREPQPGSDHPLLLKVWLVTSWDGEPANLAPGEHDDIAWFRLVDAARLELSHPGYRELFERLAACYPGRS